MADLLVRAGTIADGKIEKLIQLHKLADRVVNRDEAIAWMKSTHVADLNGERQVRFGSSG